MLYFGIEKPKNSKKRIKVTLIIASTRTVGKGKHPRDYNKIRKGRKKL